MPITLLGTLGLLFLTVFLTIYLLNKRLQKKEKQLYLARQKEQQLKQELIYAKQAQEISHNNSRLSDDDIDEQLQQSGWLSKD